MQAPCTGGVNDIKLNKIKKLLTWVIIETVKSFEDYKIDMEEKSECLASLPLYILNILRIVELFSCNEHPVSSLWVIV